MAWLIFGSECLNQDFYKRKKKLKFFCSFYLQNDALNSRLSHETTSGFMKIYAKLDTDASLVNIQWREFHKIRVNLPVVSY